MEINDYLVIAMFLTFIGLLFTGYPIALVLAGVAALFTLVGYLADLYLGAMTGLDYMYVGMVVNRIFKLMDNWVLVAIPMFIFMGLMLDRSGIAEKMMGSMQKPVRQGARRTCSYDRLDWHHSCCLYRHHRCVSSSFGSVSYPYDVKAGI